MAWHEMRYDGTGRDGGGEGVRMRNQSLVAGAMQLRLGRKDGGVAVFTFSTSSMYFCLDSCSTVTNLT
jgi:hypothetical protein